MKIGAMNNPSRDVLQEIERIAENGFDFIDLTLEPSRAYYDCIDACSIKKAARNAGLDVIGHTAFFMPIASSVPRLRECALSEIERTLQVFSEMEVSKVTVHPQWKIPLHDAEWVRQANIESFARLAQKASSLGLKLLFENVAGAWSRAGFFDAYFRCYSIARVSFGYRARKPGWPCKPHTGAFAEPRAHSGTRPRIR